MMLLRSLGTSDIPVSPLALGGNAFGRTADENASFALLDALADTGINCVDTADVHSAWAPGHSGGESEPIIGKWLERPGKRDSMYRPPVKMTKKQGAEIGTGSAV